MPSGLVMSIQPAFSHLTTNEVRERECDEIVRPPERHEAGLRYPIGDGKGVMSAIAANAGEDTVDDRIDDGESDSVLDIVFILTE
ncbi:hypothetical protein ZTR_00001 [Talaromyces verruculosus]|nr:hypothetical protein ZTR_00001 [Talaromyces verruculosus]